VRHAAPFKILVWKSEGRRPLEVTKCRRENNIKMDLKAVGLEDVSWICLAKFRDRWEALMDMAMNLPVV
jgi:hypothetical protein